MPGLAFFMNEITEPIIDALLDREAAVGGVVFWAGQELPCSGGDSLEGKILDLGGFRFNARVVLVVRIAVLDPAAGRPLPKQSVRYISEPCAAPRLLRVDTVTTLYNEVLVLGCNDPNDGA